MSYILDALQRADQERSLGQVPKLDMALQPALAGQRRSWLPTALLVMVIASLVASAGWLYEAGAFNGILGSNNVQPPETTTALAKPPPAAPAPQPVVKQETAAIAEAPASQSDEASPQASSQPPRETLQPAAAVVTAAATRPEPQLAARPEPAPAKPVIPDRPPTAYKPEETNRSPRLPTPTVAPAPPPSWARNGNSRSPEPAARERVSTKSMTSYLGLPKATRDNIPALNMNAHVFSTNPARSFVLINSKRYRIGDFLAEGPELVDILPDGAVLEHRGSEFLLPVQR